MRTELRRILSATGAVEVSPNPGTPPRSSRRCGSTSSVTLRRSSQTLTRWRRRGSWRSETSWSSSGISTSRVGVRELPYILQVGRKTNIFFFIKIILIPAEFILSRDISVPAIVLQNQQNFFPASLRVVLRRDLASSLPASIRVGRWSPQDQTRIIENLQDLQARVLHSVSRIKSEELLTPAVLCHQQPSRASKAPTIGFGTKYRGISCP